VAGRIAEVASGQSWSALFQERIKGPLGMLMTGYGMTQNPHPSGSALSRLRDYGNFLQMQLDDGRFGSTRVLSAASVREMRKNQTAKALVGYSPAPAHPYGLGEFLETWNSRGAATAVSHPGLFGFYPWIDLRQSFEVFLVAITSVPSDSRGRSGSWCRTSAGDPGGDRHAARHLDDDGCSTFRRTTDLVNAFETGRTSAADTDRDGYLDGDEVDADRSRQPEIGQRLIAALLALDATSARRAR
jgi:hypothetical protein